MKILTTLSILFSLTISVLAQTQNVSGILHLRGMGDSILPKSKTANAQSEKNAIRAAAVNAIDRAIELQSDALRQQYSDRVKGFPEREDQVRKLIYDIQVKTERSPKEGLTHATVRGKMDTSKLRDLLNSLSPKSNSAANGRSDLGVAVFFTVRRTSSASNQSKVVSKSTSGDNLETSGTENITEHGIEINESNKETSTASRTTTNIKEADKLTYEFDGQMKDAFGTGLLTKLAAKGFESIEDGSDYDSSEAIDKDITLRGSPSKTTRRTLVKELQEDPEIKLYIIGTLDFSLPRKDPITGLYVVNTTMSGKVYKIRPGKKTGRFVAGLGPKSFKGKGLTQEEAKKDILEAMAPLAADEIVAALKNNNVIN